MTYGEQLGGGIEASLPLRHEAPQIGQARYMQLRYPELWDKEGSEPRHPIVNGSHAPRDESITPLSFEATNALAQATYARLYEIGYETLQGYPVAPTIVMSSLQEYLIIYNTSRGIKLPDDAAEFFTKMYEGSPPMLNFMGAVLELMEDVHSKGLDITHISDMIDAELTRLVQLTYRVHNTNPDLSGPGALCTEVWRSAVQNYHKTGCMYGRPWVEFPIDREPAVPADWRPALPPNRTPILNAINGSQLT